jgi:hypothetical protein
MTVTSRSRRGFAVFAALGALLALGGCVQEINVPPAPPRTAENLTGGLVNRTYAAVDAMLGHLPGDLAPGSLVLVASTASLDNLDESSRLGRLLGEQIGARLVQRGYTVREVKLTPGLRVRERDGEFMLSRRLREIQTQYSADVAVTGTYSLGASSVFVNLRMTRLGDGVILTAQDFQIPRDADIVRLTSTAQGDPALPTARTPRTERVPAAR